MKGMAAAGGSSMGCRSGGCGRGQRLGKTRRLGDSKLRSFPFVLQVLRSVSSLFFSLRRGEAANDREKEQAVDECKQKGHIVLVMSGWRYCDLMSLEQSDPSKIGRATASTSDGNTPRFLWSCHTPITVEMGNGMGMGLQGCENGLEDRVSSDMCPQAVHPFDFWTHILMVLLQEVGDELVELIEMSLSLDNDMPKTPLPKFLLQLVDLQRVRLIPTHQGELPLLFFSGVGQELIAGTDDKNGEQDEYVNMMFLDVGLLL
ncbi:hypothetical protein TRIUR3_22257 [Triticum urartu]|uniref:Uncharacterized protein n=1 Tax=Triticum urartu TaxID=4572 RepID=M7Z8T9_TRIUA|nr:hypothetical protein TRIUR3_22257 [Triticum urartu]